MNSNFEDLLKALGKEQSSKNIYKILYNIRKEVEWPKNKENINKIHREGTIIHFISNLQSSHKHIVDLCLSILGNLFLDKNCAEDAVLSFEVLPALVKVLKRYAKEDSIIGRSYKAIGNLCQQLNYCAITIINESPYIITQLSEVLESFSNQADSNILYSEATIMMVIRALRCITNPSTVRFLTVKFQILSALGAVLIKLCNDWTQNKTHEKLLEIIIDILYGFSKYKDYIIINVLKNTKKGNAMEKLADLLTLNNKKIMKIIMNFIKISKLKSDLPVPEIVNKFVEEVFGKYIDPENGEFNTESFQYIDCLCYLFEHPANRNAYQCAKLIPLLIKILEKLNSDDTHLRCCILIVNTLNKCKYEENLLQEQLKCNIIDILIKKLQLLATEDFYTNHKVINLKRSQEVQNDQKESDGKKKKKSCTYCTEVHSVGQMPPNCVSAKAADHSPRRQYSPVSSGFSDDEPSHCLPGFSRSPSPCSSSSSDYTGLSWPSPQSRTSLNVDASFSDSDYYSPVCSEDEDEEYPVSTNLTDFFEVLDRHGTFEKQEEDAFDHKVEVPQGTTNMLEKRLILAIRELINSYVKLKPPVSQLGSEDFLLAIINATEFFVDGKTLSKFILHRTINTVALILHSPVYLLPLMKTPFIEKISKLTEYIHSVNCEICYRFNFVANEVLKKLTEIAESAVGKGNLAHELLRGSDEFRTQLVLSIIYVVENKSILFKLLLNCGGLNTIMSILRGDSICKNQSIKGICILACKRLKIKNPKAVAIKLGFGVKDQMKPSENPVNVVTFKLDDGMCIKADRDYLTNKSDYFNRLLTGHFKESSEDEIHLHDVKSQTLNCLLQILTDKDIWHKADIDTLLDVILLSDGYLMNDLSCFVTNFVEKHRINCMTVPTIYRWSLESGLNLLRVESVAYALVAHIPDVSRFKMFDSLFALGYSDELTDDIEKLLLRYLNSFQN
ncbi:uncharacterized protein LOC126881194 [Diabrotica virgifera virgifera]|uniref:BTB domain-containing protein n=2 Tax=Diabrotica virgifera virgifera TaxID=50390 RepID=A0ABM5JTI9_DIAVI|nr:uncharacterized protein LOC126881194 [Diabrotica virgifera virgifera]